MKKLTILLAAGACAIALNACGGDKECGVTLTGAKLCGDDARAYCTLIEGTGANLAEGTEEFCDGIR